MKKYLELVCKGHKVEIHHNGVYVLDFPQKNMNLGVLGRIDIHFAESSEYNMFKKQNRNSIQNDLESIRFYWNKNQINIYPEKKFRPEYNDKGLEMKVMKYIEIIRKTFTNTRLIEDNLFPMISD